MENTKILIAKLPEPSRKYPLSLEKLSPVLAYFVVKDEKDGFRYAQAMLEMGGLGHSAVIHSDDEALCKAYGEAMKAGRVIANSPSSQGAIGDIYNTNTPSLTLGCGSFGRNSTTSNVSTVNLINKKRVVHRRVNMQWFKIPPKIYFEKDSVQYLAHMPNIKRAFIVTDPSMVKLGYVDKILYYLRKRNTYCHSEIFDQVEPDPSVETIQRGVQAMTAFQPDVIIALGGGSAMDAAKGMWLFYEYPDTSFDGLRLKFLDIRKRVFHYPNLGKKAQMVCIPTTSGTGSEVTSFSVITDKKNGNIKYPLADYELTPDVAIIDPQFVETLPKVIVADTGLDCADPTPLRHMCRYWPPTLPTVWRCSPLKWYLNTWSAASTMRGIPWPGKRCTTPPVSRVWPSPMPSWASTTPWPTRSAENSMSATAGLMRCCCLTSLPTTHANRKKFVTWPKYGTYTADKRYARVARYLNMPGDTVEAQVQSLIDAIRSLTKKLGIPSTLKELGIDEQDFLSKTQTIAQNAFEDQCTTANPVYPRIKDLEGILLEAYYGGAKESAPAKKESKPKAEKAVKA